MAAILKTSRVYNAEHGVTGLLLYSQGKYYQVLEGEEAEVRSLFIDRISKDKRHHSITLLEEQKLEARNFPEWSMGFYWENDAGTEEFAMLNLQSSRVLEVMSQIKQRMAEQQVEMPL